MRVRKWLVIFIGYTICSTDPLKLKAFTDSILGFVFRGHSHGSQRLEVGRYVCRGANAAYTRHGRD